MKKVYVWIALTLVVGLIGWQVITRIKDRKGTGAGSGRERGSAEIAVEIAPVLRQDISEVASFGGNLIPRSSFLLAPRVSGQLLRLHAEVGQSISRGQLVAELDDRIFKLELEKARAAVAVARAQAEQSASALSLSEIEFDNQRQLFDKGYLSRFQYDQAAAQLQSDRSKDSVARAALNSANAALSAAEIQLSYTKITADWTGGASTRVVGERLADEGATLNAGIPIYRLMDITSVIAETDVVEKDYTRIKPGQSVIITADSYPGESFQGKVLRMAPLLAESSRQAKVEIEIANSSYRLKPGMFVRTAITYATKRDVLTVPIAALTRFSGNEGVFHVDEETKVARFVPLEIGIRGTEFAEVISPMLEGSVVVLGQDLLDDGSKVLLPGDENNANQRNRRGAR